MDIQRNDYVDYWGMIELLQKKFRGMIEFCNKKSAGKIDFAENILYEKLLADQLPANLGYVYENLVAQKLKNAGNELFYFTWPKDEKHNYR